MVHSFETLPCLSLNVCSLSSSTLEWVGWNVSLEGANWNLCSILLALAHSSAYQHLWHQFNMIFKHRGRSAYHLHIILGQGKMVCVGNLQSARKFKPVKIMHKKESLNKLVCCRLWQILFSHNNLFTMNMCVQTSTLSKLYYLLPSVSDWVVNQCRKIGSLIITMYKVLDGALESALAIHEVPGSGQNDLATTVLGMRAQQHYAGVESSVELNTWVHHARWMMRYSFYVIFDSSKILLTEIFLVSDCLQLLSRFLDMLLDLRFCGQSGQTKWLSTI